MTEKSSGSSQGSADAAMTTIETTTTSPTNDTSPPPPPTTTNTPAASTARRPKWYRNKTSRANATKSQRKGLRDLFPKWGRSFGYCEKLTEGWVRATYGRGDTVVLDIGFGCGDALVKMAQADPDTNFLGIDWHTPGVGKCLLALEKHNVTNVRLLCCDAVTFLKQNIEEGLRFVKGANLFFPDPWSRDKRVTDLRVLRPEFVFLLGSRCVPGATLHLATDVPGYPEYALPIMHQIGWTGDAIPRPTWRPVTPYEQKGRDEGRPSVDMIFTLPDVVPEVPEQFRMQVREKRGELGEEEKEEEEEALCDLFD